MEIRENEGLREYLEDLVSTKAGKGVCESAVDSVLGENRSVGGIMAKIQARQIDRESAQSHRRVNGEEFLIPYVEYIPPKDIFEKVRAFFKERGYLEKSIKPEHFGGHLILQKEEPRTTALIALDVSPKLGDPQYSRELYVSTSYLPFHLGDKSQ